MGSKETYPSLTLRPYQLLCVICSIGEGSFENKRLREILDTIKVNPDVPVTLNCNVGDVYAYQDPGEKEDTPEGSDYNRKRDLDILQRLDLVPGSTLPARTLLLYLLKRITTVSGICGYDTVTSEAWRGCPKAEKGYYEKAHKFDLDAFKLIGIKSFGDSNKGKYPIISPRSEAEMIREKRESLKALYSAKEVRIRPHILLCAVCQYGAGVRPPFKEDNLPEFLDMILNNKPDVPVTLVRGADWMMCAPCPWYDSRKSTCFTGQVSSAGLFNELKDLNVLQRLGLTYGTTMKAKELYNLIFEKIPVASGVCALEADIPAYSIWRDGCGSEDVRHNYEKGREMLMGKFAQLCQQDY